MNTAIACTLAFVLSFAAVFGGLTLTNPETLGTVPPVALARDLSPAPATLPTSAHALAAKGRTVAPSRAILAPATAKRWGCRPWTDSLVGGQYRACGWY